jgi:hypothetical protein
MNDPSKGGEWGPDREVRADRIHWLCTNRAAADNVDPRGVKLFGALVTGTLDLSYATVPFPLCLLHCRLMHQIIVASAHLPALYLNGSRSGPIVADGLSVEGGLFLRAGFVALGEVRLLNARIGGNLDCSGATFENLPQKGVSGRGKALDAGGARISGNVFLREGFVAEGEVWLPGAQIDGDLDCHGGTFRNPAQREFPDSGKALTADAVSVRGGVFLSDGFTAEGGVRLIGAQIGGVLHCSGAKLKNPPQRELPETGYALCADRAVVGSGIFLRGPFVAEGEVSLVRARIGADLDCSAGTLKNIPQEGLPMSGDALKADRVDVRGSVYLRDGFTAQGEVRMLGAQIVGNLDCSGGTFTNPHRSRLPEISGKALSADRVNVKGNVFLRHGFAADGWVRLLGSRVEGDLDCRGGLISALSAEGAKIGRIIMRGVDGARGAAIDLMNASTDALLDDEVSWPAKGMLLLDDFVYGRISEGPTDAETRLKWLALQPKFEPQPYRQLAIVLREMGDDHGARKVLYEMQRRARGEAEASWIEATCIRLWNWTVDRCAPFGRWLLKWIIGYGYYPYRALLGLAVLTLLGTVLFGLGYMGGSMAPAEQEAYTSFEKQGWPPRHYQQFNPFVYSLENSVPFLKLGQDSAWAPDPGPREQERAGAVNLAPFKWLARVASSWRLTWLARPWFLRFFRWGQIIVGWMLATLFVAGVTGVVRRG